MVEQNKVNQDVYNKLGLQQLKRGQFIQILNDMKDVSVQLFFLNVEGTAEQICP